MYATRCPHVSLIVVNYNGKKYLHDCLSAVAETDYPRESLEVILVDNASSDGSVEFVRKAFPWVRVIQNQRNLGYAGGNNVAIKQARGKYVALLNNDTRVEPAWLKELVRAAESDPSVGACTSQLQYMNNRLVVGLHSDTLRPSDLSSSDDFRELGITISEAGVVDLQYGHGVHYVSGVYEQERGAAGPFRWTAGEARFAIDVPDVTQPLRLRLGLGWEMPDNLPARRVRLEVDGVEYATLNVAPDRSRTICEVVLPPEALSKARPTIQNAGTLLLADGSGKDREIGLARDRAISREDEMVAASPEEVFGFCGASVLIRRDVIEQVGMFDDWFFAYYEDLDLAWRMRLRGWKVVYVPTSVVRHVHCGTSVEWSRFFRYHVKRNRLAMLFKNAPLSLAYTAACRHIAELSDSCRRVFLAVRRRDLESLRQALGEVWLDVQVSLALTSRVARILAQRWAVRRHRNVDDSRVLAWMAGV